MKIGLILWSALETNLTAAGGYIIAKGSDGSNGVVSMLAEADGGGSVDQVAPKLYT